MGYVGCTPKTTVVCDTGAARRALGPGVAVASLHVVSAPCHASPAAFLSVSYDCLAQGCIAMSWKPTHWRREADGRLRRVSDDIADEHAWPCGSTARLARRSRGPRTPEKSTSMNASTKSATCYGHMCMQAAPAVRGTVTDPWTHRCPFPRVPLSLNLAYECARKPVLRQSQSQKTI